MSRGLELIMVNICICSFAEWGEGVDSDGHPGGHLGHALRSRVPSVEQVQVEGGEITY